MHPGSRQDGGHAAPSVPDDVLREQVYSQLDRGRASLRARRVADILLERGECTTTDLEALGYKHPPRAVRDLREAGVRVGTRRERYEDPDSGQGKTRAVYFLDGVDPSRASRQPIARSVREQVLAARRCAVCGGRVALQVDHRVPFEIGGEVLPHRPDDFMALCASCNRSKSWTCEHCANWRDRNSSMCQSCLWASPDDYVHVAMRVVRELRIVVDDPQMIEILDRLQPNLDDVLADYVRRHQDD